MNKTSCKWLHNKKSFEINTQAIIYILIAILIILLMGYGVAEAAKRIFH